MEISPKRIIYLDEVRSLAIILVVVGHLVRFFSKDIFSYQVSSAVFAVTRIGVPLFFTVSGALLLTRKHNIEQFLSKRFKRVVLPLFFWIIVYIIAGVLIWHDMLSANYIFNVAFGIGDYSSVFWFVWSLIGVYLLIPVLSSFIREYGDFGAQYLILITVILSILFTAGFFSIEKIKFNFKVIFYFFSVLGYFIMGSYFHNHMFDISDKKMFALGILLVIVGFAGHFYQIYMKGVETFVLSPVDYFDIFLMAETVGLFIAFKYANVKWFSSNIRPIKEQALGKVIVLFSSCSFGIYFSHYILIRYLFHSTGVFHFLTLENVLVGLPLSAILLISISWLMVWIMSKIPILKIGSGVK